MKRTVIAAAAVLLLLVGCRSKAPVESSIASEAVPATEATGFLVDGAFSFAPLADAKTISLLPVAAANNQLSWEISLPAGIAANDPVMIIPTDRLYSLYDTESKTAYGTIILHTAPPDLAAAYGSDDREEQLSAMKPNYFLAADMHEGYRKNIIEDFDYGLMADEFGTAFGGHAYYIEFDNPYDEQYGLRFYASSDVIDENFTSIQVNLNLPRNDRKAVELGRSIIFSLQTNQP